MIADDRLGDLERRTVAAAFDLLGQDHVDVVAREDEAGDAGRRVHRNGDCAHAGAERRGEEAAVLRADERAAGDRLAGRDRIADDGAHQRLRVRVGGAFHVIGALHQLLRPGLIGEAVGIDDGADRHRLLGDEHLGPDRERASSSRSSLLRTCAGEHILGHDGGDHRNDQRSNEQSELLHIHGAIASPKTGPLNSLRHQAKWLRNRWASICPSIARPPNAIATPYGISGRPSRRLARCQTSTTSVSTPPASDIKTRNLIVDCR